MEIPVVPGKCFEAAQALKVLLSQVTSEWTRGSGLRLHQGRLRLDIREKFFTERCWTRLLRAVVESASLEGFKNHVDVALGDVV